MSKKRGRSRPARLYHGGVAGLRPREQVLPAASLPSGLPAQYATGSRIYENAEADVVYLTSDRAVARSYAARWSVKTGQEGGGAVYAVDVKGPLKPDPDYYRDPGLCWKASVVFVAAVEETGVLPSFETLLPGFRLVWWDDDITRMYSPEGYAVPNALARAAGVTSQDLRPLGVCPDFGAIKALLNQLIQRQLSNPARAEATLAWAVENAPDRVRYLRAAIAQARSNSGRRG